MKKVLLGLFLFLGLFIYSGVFAAEKIDSYHVNIEINQDSSIDVSEKIKYDFGATQRHGIFRDIPVKYKARGGSYNLRISDISVVDENGKPYNFIKSKKGQDLQIKIGDADKYVTGKNTYVINYKIKRAINFFENHDELYWNAIGEEWSIDMNNPTVSVSLPENIQAGDIRKECFTGIFGSTEKCAIASYNSEERSLYFQSRNLRPTEGMTVVIGVPKGIIIEPTALDKLSDVVKDNWILLVPFIVLFVMYYLWRTKGKDPVGRGAIIAQFDAPDELTPLEVGTIIDEKAENRDVSAEIIYLAVKGYIKITKLEKKYFFSSTDYLFEKLKEADDLENDFDKKLMDGIFVEDKIEKTLDDLKDKLKEKGVNEGSIAYKIVTGIIGSAIDSDGNYNNEPGKQVVKLSYLKNRFYKDLTEIIKQVYKIVVSKGYFPKNPNTVRIIYIAIAVFAFISGFIIGPVFGVFGIFSMIASGIIIFIFAIYMPAKTKKGAYAWEYIMGLKEYLKVAEKDRIKFHNAPEKNPEQFEKLLPYAMVLGVEEEWAKQFEGIYNQQPSWYNDPSGARFNSLALAHGLNSFSTSANTSLASRPSSASGGGSGFSGGGGGGGFGGGGGGSW